MDLIVENLNDPRLTCDLCRSKLSFINSEATCCSRKYVVRNMGNKFLVKSYNKKEYSLFKNVESEIEEGMEIKTLDEETSNLLAEVESSLEDDDIVDIDKLAPVSIPDMSEDDVIVQ